MDSQSQMNNSSVINQTGQDQNVTASVCRSVPNGLNDLNSKIAECTTTAEQKRINNFGENVIKLERDLESLSGTVMDSLMMGDSMFGQFGYADIAKQVKDRNTDLKMKKETLVNNIEKSEAIIERSNRDFSDVKDSVPEPQPKRVLRFIEDYTLAILAMAYLFMIIAVMYIYTLTAEYKLVAFGKIFVGSTLLSAFLFMLLYFLA